MENRRAWRTAAYSAIVIHEQSHSSRWAYAALTIAYATHVEAQWPARLVLSHYVSMFTNTQLRRRLWAWAAELF